MNSEWTDVTLGELITLQRGHDLPAQNRRTGNVPIMGSAGVTGYHDEATTKGPGVVIGRSGVGSMGVVSYIERDYWALNTTLFVKDFHGNDERFIYYLLGTVNFRQFDTGSAQASLNRNLVYPYRIRVPDAVAEQRKIAHILNALDDRISLLHETNATLEAIAQALFKSWFVDFGPVRSRMDDSAPDGMNESTLALFPKSLKESELGVVPDGWRYGTLADLSDLNPESWTERAHPDSILYVDLANTKDNEIKSAAELTFAEAPSRARRVLRSGDTIVGTVRPGNRSFAFIHKPAINLTASTGFAVLRPLFVENAEFVYLAATQTTSIEHLAHVADGGAYPAVRPNVVSALRCVMPCKAVLEAFHKVAEPLLVKVSENQKQAQTLAAIRDILLPRLISGQLRLPELQYEEKTRVP